MGNQDSAVIVREVFSGRFRNMPEEYRGLDHFVDTEPNTRVMLRSIGRWNEEGWYVAHFPRASRAAVGYAAAALWGDVGGGTEETVTPDSYPDMPRLSLWDGSCQECGADWDEMGDGHTCPEEQDETDPDDPGEA